MTEERKQELRQLLEEAMACLEIRWRSGNRSSSIPVDVYEKHLQERWTSYSLDNLSVVMSYEPYIVNEATKSKLLDFIRAEFALFIHDDRIQSASSFVRGSLGFSDGFPLKRLLEQILRIAIVRGIEGAISAIDRCLVEASGSFQAMALLEGIKLEAEIQAFEGIRLVPLPSSTFKIPHYLLHLANSWGKPANFFKRKTLLIIDCSVSPIFCKPFGITPIEELLTQENSKFQAEVNGENFPNFKVDNFYEKFCLVVCHN